MDSAAANYAVSRSGALVHVPAGTVDSPGSLVWVDRSGRQSPTGAPPHIYAGPRLSPDGTRVAVTVADRQNDLHVLDLKKGTLLRLAQSPAVESSPVWTRDGQRLVFASNRDGGPNLYAQAADGTGTVERLTNAPDWQHPAWVAPDGTGILGSEISPKTAGDIVWFPIQDSARRTLASLASSETPRRLVETLGIDYFPEVSPNGRFIAYQSNESGRSEIYVRPFPRVDEGVWHVSVNGGLKPVWARNGRELFYLDPAHALIAVPVETSGTTFGFGKPSKLFDTSVDASYAPRDYDVAADGRFLMVERSDVGEPTPADARRGAQLARRVEGQTSRRALTCSIGLHIAWAANKAVPAAARPGRANGSNSSHAGRTGCACCRAVRMPDLAARQAVESWARDAPP